MITEYVLILGLFAFVLGGVFFGDNGPRAIFLNSAPRLAARIEMNVSTGRAFLIKGNAPLEWDKPSAAAPNEEL